MVALQVTPVREVIQMPYSFGNERLCCKIKVCEAAGRNLAALVRPTDTKRTIGIYYSKATIILPSFFQRSLKLNLVDGKMLNTFAFSEEIRGSH